MSAPLEEDNTIRFEIDLCIPTQANVSFSIALSLSTHTPSAPPAPAAPSPPTPAPTTLGRLVEARGLNLSLSLSRKRTQAPLIQTLPFKRTACIRVNRVHFFNLEVVPPSNELRTSNNSVGVALSPQ